MLTAPDRDHEHPQRRRRPRRARRGTRSELPAGTVEPGRCRSSARRTTACSTTSTASTSGRSTSRGARRGDRRPGRRGQRRRRHRDGLPRVQGRDRDGVAGHRRPSSAATRSASWSRPTTASATGCGWTACRSVRRSASTRSPARTARRGASAQLGPAAGLGLDHRRRRDRRAAAAPPVRARGPTRRARHRPGRRDRRPHERRPVHRVRDRQPPPDRGSTTGRRCDYDVRAVGDRVIDALFDGVIEATEEAIVNALVAATTMVGRDGITAHALPHDRLLETMARYGRGTAARLTAAARPGGFARQPSRWVGSLIGVGSGTIVPSSRRAWYGLTPRICIPKPGRSASPGRAGRCRRRGTG